MTIKFKGDNGNVEEIHIKDKPGKKKKVKSKAKPKQSASNPEAVQDPEKENTVVIEKPSQGEPKSEDNKSKQFLTLIYN